MNTFYHSFFWRLLLQGTQFIVAALPRDSAMQFYDEGLGEALARDGEAAGDCPDVTLACGGDTGGACPDVTLACGGACPDVTLACGGDYPDVTLACGGDTGTLRHWQRPARAHCSSLPLRPSLPPPLDDPCLPDCWPLCLLDYWPPCLPDYWSLCLLDPSSGHSPRSAARSEL